MSSLVQRIIDELNQNPQTVNQLSVGVSGVYLRSMLNALVELGMVHEHKTWPRTYSLVSAEPDHFKPTDDRASIMFEELMAGELDKLPADRITAHIVKTIRSVGPEDLLNLKQFMNVASAKIQELLENLEPISVDEIVVKK